MVEGGNFARAKDQAATGETATGKVVSRPTLVRWRARTSEQKCSGDRIGTMAGTVVSAVAALKPGNEREKCGWKMVGVAKTRVNRDSCVSRAEGGRTEVLNHSGWWSWGAEKNKNS